ncbi:MAG: DUF4433 domain-containing protein [Deltaproteobacteria bacterium]|nr:DUF4433 domain-containing protein [Deltaproteobacteria bacterium]
MHADRLPSFIADGSLWCDAEIVRRKPPGTTIGMNGIKQRRLQLYLSSHPNLHVGDCVPFYFCPRSIMLYLIYRGNDSELDYKGGQASIIHLKADLYDSVKWAMQNNKRWAFTLSNAGAYYFEDRCNLEQLNEIDWDSVNAGKWVECKEGKQAEFLIEYSFPWHLIEHVGVYSQAVYQQVVNVLPVNGHRPKVEVKTDWYY